MSANPIEEIIKFQKDRGLDKKEFNSFNENTSIAEEMMEAHGFDIPKENREELKEGWKDFLGKVKFKKKVKEFTINMVVDAYCDMIVFAIGAIMKLGYNPTIALTEAAKEINSREGTVVNGKFEKDLSDEAKAKWYKADYDLAKMTNSDDRRVFLVKNPIVSFGRVVVNEPEMRAIYIIEPMEGDIGDETVDLEGTQSLGSWMEDKELQLRGYGL